MDARIKKTKEAVSRALLDLLRKKYLSQITVSELCKAAGVNRNTFYAHYHTPVEVVEDVTAALLDDFDALANAYRQSQDVCVAICRYIYERRDVFAVLASANVEERYVKIALSQARQSAASGEARPSGTTVFDKYYDEFFIGGCYFVLKAWIDDGAKESPEEIGAALHSLFVKSKEAQRGVRPHDAP